MNVFSLFLSNNNVVEHYVQIKKNYKEYFSKLIFLFGNDIYFPNEQKSTILAAIIAYGDRELFSTFVKFARITIVDLRDAVRLLISLKHDKRIPSLTSRRKEMINELYFKQLPPETLRFHLLKYSSEAFREVIDLTHPHPERHWQDPDFQYSVFGEKRGVIGYIRDVLKEPTVMAAEQLIRDHRIPWHYLRSKLPPEIYRHPRILRALLETESPTVLLSHLEVFPPHDQQIKKTLNKIIQTLPQTYKLNIGVILKALRRTDLLEEPSRNALKLIADNMLRELSSQILLNGDSTAVIADLSGSMDFAKDFAILLSAILSFTKKTDIHGFNEKYIMFPFRPRNFHDALRLMKRMTCHSFTAPALVLEHFMRLGGPEDTIRAYDTLIIVTDEEENESGDFYRDFSEAWTVYKKLVFQKTAKSPRLIFITIGRSRHMTNNLPKEDYIRIEIPLDVDRAIRTIQGILTVLSSPDLTFITTKLIEERIETPKDIMPVFETVKKHKAFFSLAETMVTIDDYTKLEWDDPEPYRQHFIKLRLIVQALGLQNLVKKTTDLITMLNSRKKISSEQRQEISDFLNEIRTMIAIS